ncbi:hypothetical protein AMR41_11815 [Hapalosiphon sp. MRB220]|nr:hypothetical protein AMR41_11815 [Hapalosiphon sp. MRB220]
MVDGCSKQQTTENKKPGTLVKFRVLTFHRHDTLPGTYSGPKIKVKPATEVSHDDRILLKKQKPQSSLCGSPGGFHEET